ncbi:MAG: type IV secretion system DNA-binding domain-containing protein [Verrucomicrobia bacterium]|nr:type IV secretion system DNA-binding domain-containing protein [Verrucomicrobiota bacterium]
MNDDPIQLGFRAGYASESPFGLGAADARRHIYVVGQTGVGKSTLLFNLILQHLHAGHGVAVLDPHGDLAETLLDHFPTWRADDLVYFNPADADFPVGFNPLANVPPDQRALATAGLVSAFKSIWRDSWGPRLEYILTHTVAALMEVGNTSLLGVNRMLSEEGYRAWVVRQVRDPFIRAFWTEEFGRYDARFLREAIAPVQNKIGQLLLSPFLRNVLGQTRCKIDLRFMMDSRRVLIANLSKGKLGAEPANLLGALLAAQFQHAAMTRSDTPEHEREDFHLLIDEFHNFTTDSLASALSEARKYRLGLVLSHQYLDQLRPEVRSAVFGNVGTIVSFRVGASDADVLAKEFGQEFTVMQFADLDRHEVFVRLMEDGSPSVPFRAKSIPPLGSRHNRRHKLIARSREKYGTRRAGVEDRLRRWLASPCYNLKDAKTSFRTHGRRARLTTHAP